MKTIADGGRFFSKDSPSGCVPVPRAPAVPSRSALVVGCCVIAEHSEPKTYSRTGGWPPSFPSALLCTHICITPRGKPARREQSQQLRLVGLDVKAEHQGVIASLEQVVNRWATETSWWRDGGDRVCW